MRLCGIFVYIILSFVYEWCFRLLMNIRYVEVRNSFYPFDIFYYLCLTQRGRYMKIFFAVNIAIPVGLDEFASDICSL